MIISKIAHKTPIWQKLVDYVLFSEKQSNPNNKHFSDIYYSQNIFSEFSEPAEIVNEFKRNYTFKRKFKGEVLFYHEILSFAPETTQYLTEEKLRGLVADYMALRTPESVCVGKIHRDQAHLHFHLVFSSNKYLENKSVHMNNHQYNNLRKNIEAIQIFKYGIKNSIVHLEYREIERIKSYLEANNVILDIDNIHQIEHLYTHQKTPKQKKKNKEKFIKERGELPKNELIEKLVKQAFEEAENIDHFKRIIEQNSTIEAQIYARGKHPLYGVVYGKYKRRLTSILSKNWKELLNDRNIKNQSIEYLYDSKMKNRRDILQEIEKLKEVKFKKGQFIPI
jgi:hypothetical protein